MNNVYTMKDWEKDGVFSANIGQEVESSVFHAFLNCVPPAFYDHYMMQVGEPYATDRATFKDLFITFVRNEKCGWTFAGYCLYGKTENRPTL